MANFKKRRLIKAWLPVALWMGVIFVASTDLGSAEHTSRVIEPLVRWIKPDATPEQFDLVHFLVRKTAHLTEYSILGLLLLRAVRMSSAAQTNPRSLRLLGIALLLSAAYASMDEFHQSFVPGRTACVQDVLIDTTGALFGLAITSFFRRTTRKAEDDSVPEVASAVGK
jgi:VanZ family protein